MWAPNGGFVPQQNIISYNIDFHFWRWIISKPLQCSLFDLHQAEVKGWLMEIPIWRRIDNFIGKVVPGTGGSLWRCALFTGFHVDKYTTPSYDKSQDIYNALQKRLDTAIMYIVLPVKSSFGPADIINRGNVVKWIKFANTLKLRLLIRQSEISGFDPSAEIAKIQNNGGVLGAGESISVNPGYVNDVNKQNSFLRRSWLDTRLVLRNRNQSTDANAYIINILSQHE